MVINGSTAYTQNFVSMGNTTINTSYIEADNILVNQNLEILKGFTSNNIISGLNDVIIPKANLKTIPDE